MKQKFTKQKSANRHPKKYNFNYIETLPVWRMRMEGYSRPEDAARHDAEIKRRQNGETQTEVEIIRPYGYNSGVVTAPSTNE